MTKPLMPKATAVWLIDNTRLTFEQIGAYCDLHELEVQALADGDIGVGIKGRDPVDYDELTSEEIARCEEDSAARLVAKQLTSSKSAMPRAAERTRGPRYTPVTKRQDKPDAIAWLLRNHPELSDGQIGKLVGTTKTTITAVRERTHWNTSNIRPQHPVDIGLCTYVDLSGAVAKARAKLPAEEREALEAAERAALDVPPPSDGNSPFGPVNPAAAWAGLPAPIRAGLLALGAMACFTAMSVFIRLAARDVHVIEAVFFRNLLVLVFMLPVIGRLDLAAAFRPGFPWRLYMGRAVLGTAGMICGFWAITVMPFADATALSFTMPLFATAGAALLLGEVVRVRRWTAIVIGFLGALLVLRPDLSGLGFGAGLALGNAVLLAGSTLVVKKLTSREPPERIVFIAALLIAPCSLVPALFVWSWPSAETWIVLAALAGIATVGHILLTRAFAIADLTLIMPWEFTRLPMMVLAALVIFAEEPSWWALAGGSVIFASTFYVVRREAQLARQASSR